MKKILMAVTNYYTSPFQVGSHHYARAFEKLGYEILFISNPISPIHKIFANNEQLVERERIHGLGGVEIGNITYYVPKTLFTPQNKPLLSSKFILDHWYKFSYPNIQQYIKEKGFGSVDILWFDSPMFTFLLDKIEYKNSILRLADYSKGFNSVSENQYKAEIEIANRVDTVIYSAKNLKEKYTDIQNKSKMHYISNGVDLTSIQEADKSLPEEYEPIPSPIAVYIGALHEWFDVDLVYKTAISLPEYSFVIIGPVERDLSPLETLDNLFILGKKPHNRIAQFLFNADVGIIPFDTKKHKDLVESINPLKLYEYFACNLPVVSMNWHQLEELKSPAFLCETTEEFIEAIQQADKIHDKTTIKEFAQSADWSKRVTHVLESLNRTGDR
ncbi:MAG: glycosyltransferase [Campylobacterota bacterium]|nr:glycosyltransferase [Campylobacterota bacterium]